MVCAENANTVTRMLPDGWMPRGSVLPAHRLVGSYQYTRQDPARVHARLLEAATDADGGQMIYSGQTVQAGAVFVHGFRLRAALPRDLGALLCSLSLWRAQNGTVGGMASRGHGRLDMAIWSPEPLDQAGAVAEYMAHVDAVRDEAIEFLAREFGKAA